MQNIQTKLNTILRIVNAFFWVISRGCCCLKCSSMSNALDTTHFKSNPSLSISHNSQWIVRKRNISCMRYGSDNFILNWNNEETTERNIHTFITIKKTRSKRRQKTFLKKRKRNLSQKCLRQTTTLPMIILILW